MKKKDRFRFQISLTDESVAEGCTCSCPPGGNVTVINVQTTTDVGEDELKKRLTKLTPNIRVFTID